MADLRLDHALVARGLAPSRARAQELIRQGKVRLDGRTAAKPAQAVAADAAIEIAADADRHVSRGAVKLSHALAHFGFPVAGRIALDIGASTGGFSEVLLEAGAARIYAVDVGHGQLHARLSADPRIVNLERTDARKLDATLVPEPVTALVADVSFISATLALGPALALAAPGAWLVTLIKPQFEAGRAAVGKGGIVRDDAAHAAAVDRVTMFIRGQPGWRVLDVIPSPITGGDGNKEFLLGARYDG